MSFLRTRVISYPRCYKIATRIQIERSM